MKDFLSELNRNLKPLFTLAQAFAEAAEPVIHEFNKWNVSAEILNRAGWLPHYTTPFGDIMKGHKDIEQIRAEILQYYTEHWDKVRSEFETRLTNYSIDEEAKATFREALDAHGVGLYRCVVRVLFPEVERILLTTVSDDTGKPIGYKELVRKFDEGKWIEDFVSEGLYEMHLFSHLTKALRREPVSESDKLVYGWFQRADREGDRARLMQDPVPNRHGAMHGLVAYSTQQNSLNALFLADYIFGVVSKSATKESQKDSTV